MKQHINALTATRFFAAFMVFIHHYGREVFPFRLCPVLFSSGNLAVSYFFVLSGFVLYLSYAGRQLPYPLYLRRRIARIAPVYLLALGLFIAVAFGYYNYTFSHDFVKQVVYSACFAQAFFPDYALALNSPAWSLSAEMTFYILFPLLLYIAGKWPRIFLAGAIIAYAATQIVFVAFMGQYSPFTHQGAFAQFHPLMHMNQFLAGMAGGYFFTNTNPRFVNNKWLPLVVFTAIIAAISFRLAAINYQDGLIAPLFAVFIMCVAGSNPRLLNFRPLVFLGEISYGMYILQLPVHDFLDAVNKKHVHLPGQYFFYCTLVCLIGVAALSYFFFELPMRRIIGRHKNEI